MAGRRPKAPEERRTKVCYIRLTEAEWRKIQSDAIDAGLPFATYVRSRALGSKPRAKPQRDKVMGALLYELTSMATNLGQLVEATGDETYGPWANYVGGELVNRVTDRFDLAPLIEREIEAINGIGHAINAMARRANMGKEIDPAERDDTLKIMRRVLDPLHKAVAKKPVQIEENPDTDASPNEGDGDAL